MENVFIDHNLQKKVRLRRAFTPPVWRSPGNRTFQEIPLRVISVGAMLDQRAGSRGVDIATKGNACFNQK